MANALKLAGKEKKTSKRLAQLLLKAKTEDEAAGAFATINQEAAAAAAGGDVELIRKAKVAAMLSKFVMRGELAMSKIKDAFNAKAFQAKTVKEVDDAQD